MAAAAADVLGDRLKGGVVVGVRRWRSVEPVAHRCEHLTGGPPGAERRQRGAPAFARWPWPVPPAPTSSCSCCSRVERPRCWPFRRMGLTLADKQRATAILLARGRGDSPVERRQEASVGDQGRTARRRDRGARAGRCSSPMSSATTRASSHLARRWPTPARFGRPWTRSIGWVAAAAYPVAGRLPPRAGRWPERLPETPKPGDPRLAGPRCRGRRWTPPRDGGSGRRGQAPRLPRRRARTAGRWRSPRGGGEPRQAHGGLAAAADSRPVCVISSGETTVRVTGRGRGGRNQEFALAAATVRECVGPASGRGLDAAGERRHGRRGRADRCGRRDRRSDHARTREPARACRRPDAFLYNNDAYAFFAPLGDLIKTGPTGTNVGDLQVFLSV